MLSQFVSWPRSARLIVFAAMGWITSAGAQSDSGRAWTPADSIALRYFSMSQDDPTAWPHPGGEAVNVSPDGRFFFVVSHHGDLRTDSNVYELLVYDAQSIRTALMRSAATAPPASYRQAFVSFTNRPAIKSVQWADDGTALLFLAMVANRTLQVHRLEVRSGRVRQLTHHDRDVTEFCYSGGTLVYGVQPDPPKLTPLRYPMEPVTRMGTMYPGSVEDRTEQAWRAWRTARTVYMSAGGGRAQPLDLNGRALTEGRVSLSPNGRWAIAIPAPNAPAVLIDTLRARFRQLGYMRTVWFRNQVFWSPDSARVVVLGMASLDAGPLEAAAMQRLHDTGLAISYDIGSGRLQMLEPISDQHGTEPRQVSDFGWLTPGRELLVKQQTGDRVDSGTVYAFRDGQWVGRTVDPSIEVPAPSAHLDGLTVEVRQSANEPPVLTASNGAREIALSEPDPMLSQVWRARMEPVQWIEPGGLTVTGGLMLPRNYPAGMRLPLVIQAYRYYPQFFLPDGPHGGTNDAAQSLVAHGFAVLQIEAWNEGAVVTAREGPAFVEKIEAAASSLVARGIVDPARVGLTGFSRGGYMTYFAITHPNQIHLAAAVVDDSWPGSYTFYLREMIPNGMGRELGGGEFWQNREGWRELETSFNVNRVQTPVLFASHKNRGDAPYDQDRYAQSGDEIQTMGAFFLNNKPFEYLFFPDSEHMLKRPRQRLALMEAVVDWMSFWIQGAENPGKPGQNERWRQLKSDWQKVQTEAAASK